MDALLGFANKQISDSIRYHTYLLLSGSDHKTYF